MVINRCKDVVIRLRQVERAAGKQQAGDTRTESGSPWQHWDKVDPTGETLIPKPSLCAIPTYHLALFGAVWGQSAQRILMCDGGGRLGHGWHSLVRLGAALDDVRV